MKKYTEIELEEFIRESHKLLTISDIAEETGETDAYIWRFCERIGVWPLGPKEQKLKFVSDNRANMTYERVKKYLDVGDSTMSVLCRELGIGRKDFKQPEPPRPTEPPKPKGELTVSGILNGYQFDSSLHYNHAKDHPEWFAKIKEA